MLLLLSMVVLLVWYNDARREVRPSHQSRVISQIPIDRLTAMTTGRKGVFKTPYGVIEFTHTDRCDIDILNNTILYDRPLRIATESAAIRDLKRVGRNTHLIETY